jgi:DNA-directed RNA polymerase specialized sigma24 family protein
MDKPRLSEPEVIHWVNVYRNGASSHERSRAFDVLLNSVSRLMRRCCSRFTIESMSQDDLYQECLIELVDAIGIYDPAKGSWSHLIARMMHYRLVTLLKQSLKCGRKEVKMLSFDYDQPHSGDGHGYNERLDLHKALTDDSPDVLTTVADAEVYTRVMEFMRPMLSPFEWAVFEKFVQNSATSPKPDYIAIAKSLMGWRLKGRKRPVTAKAVDNAMTRVRAMMNRQRYKLNLIMGEDTRKFKTPRKRTTRAVRKPRPRRGSPRGRTRGTTRRRSSTPDPLPDPIS